MRMAVIMLLLLATLCAAAPFIANLDKSKIAKEDSQEDTVANDNVEVDLEVHYHGRNMTDLNVNREGKFQVTFGAVNFKVRNTLMEGGLRAAQHVDLQQRRGSELVLSQHQQMEALNVQGQMKILSTVAMTCRTVLLMVAGLTGVNLVRVVQHVDLHAAATKKRERTFTEPAPANGGTQCPGSNEDIVDCDLPDCVSTCGDGATLLSTSPGLDMMVCKDMTQSTCEKDFRVPGDVYWYGTRGQYPVLNTDVQLFCWWDSSRPGCEEYAGSSPGQVLNVIKNASEPSAARQPAPVENGWFSRKRTATTQ